VSSASLRYRIRSREEVDQRIVSEDELTKVGRVLQLIDTIKALDIDPADTAPDYWHHVHNQLFVKETARPYTRSRHQAWLHR
jgi:hypothetical protein